MHYTTMSVVHNFFWFWFKKTFVKHRPLVSMIFSAWLIGKPCHIFAEEKINKKCSQTTQTSICFSWVPLIFIQYSSSYLICKSCFVHFILYSNISSPSSILCLHSFRPGRDAIFTVLSIATIMRNLAGQ